MDIRKGSKAHILRNLFYAISWGLRSGRLPPDEAARLINLTAGKLGNRKPVHTAEKRQKVKSVTVRAKLIRDAHKDDPAAPYWQIASELGCDQARVATVLRADAEARRKGRPVSEKPRLGPTVDLPDDLWNFLREFMAREDRGEQSDGK